MQPFIVLIKLYYWLSIIYCITSKTSMREILRTPNGSPDISNPATLDEQQKCLTTIQLPPASFVGPLTAEQFHLTEDSKRCLHCHTVNRRKTCMVCCWQCRLKAHASCVGLTRASAAALPRWICQPCRQGNSPDDNSPELTEQTSCIKSMEHLVELVSKWRTRIPIIQIIPKGARICVADALTDTLKRLRTEPTLSAWTRYFSFSFICLRKPSSKDQSSESLTALIKRQTRHFIERFKLPVLPPRSPQKTQEMCHPSQIQRRSLRSS